MASGAQQLAADFEQVQKRLLLYPGIKILETEGDPPDRYDIEYNIKGYELKSDGTPVPSNKHRIRITLPFGYPHFSPNVKPLTPVYHPDIDPDAIRIADFWQDNKSLADLIIHIGTMICGISYQRDEPFNQEAYDWYEERQDWLPFDTLDPKESDDDSAATEEVPDDTGENATNGKKTEESVPTSGKTLDILNEDLDFPFDDEPEDIGLDLSEDTPQTDEDDFSFDLDLTEEEPAEESEIDLFTDTQEEPEEDLTLSLEDEEEAGTGEQDTDEQELHDPTADAASGEDSREPGDLGGLDEEEDDIFDLTGEDEEEISFDLLEEEDATGTGEQDTGEQELHDLTADAASADDSREPGDFGGLDDEEDDIFDLTGEDEGEETGGEKHEENEKELQGSTAGAVPEEPGIEPGDLEDLTEEEKPVFDLQGEDDDEVPLGPTEEEFDETDVDAQLQTPLDLSGLRDEDQDADSDGIDLNEEAEDIEEVSLAGLELDDGIGGESGSDPGKGKARAIRPLIEQKKMFTAKKILADVSDPGSIPDLEELEDLITHAITKAEDLYRKADKLEQAGELEKAGLTLDLVANEAVDYPGLEFARNRIRDSLLAKDTSEETQKDDKDKKTDTLSKKKKKGIAKPGFKLPYRIMAIVLVLIGILAAATLFTIKDTDNIKQAYADFNEAKQFLEKKEFKHAQKSLDAASAALNDILFLQKDEREELREKIKTITDSQNFQEGLKGRVLYEGKYVTVEMAKKIDSFNSQIIDAETQENSGNIDEAIQFYQQAADTAKQINFEEQEKNIRQTINRLQLKKALTQARLAEEEQEWKQAADTYAQALELSKDLSSSSDKIDIENRLAAAAFRHELSEGQRAFTASEWQKTIEMLQSAEQILKSNPEIASEAEKDEIRKLLIYSRLYHILSGAKNAFEKKEWGLAVNQYKNAIYLLENNKEMLGDKADSSIKKIEKTILMTEISREQHQNSLAIENNDLPESLESYRTIASLIQNSSFQDDETLGKILADARTQVAALEDEIRINSRVDWLKRNYEEIFRKMYPSARSSELRNPQVTFIKEEDDKLIFTMSCVEKRQGRSFRLELNYQYDQKEDSWDIYSGTF